MVLMFHVIIAISSLAIGGLALSRADKSLLGFQVVSFALTILSGIVLVVLHPAALTHLCVSGLVFSGITLGLILATRRRLAIGASF